MQATRGLALLSSKRNPSFSDSKKVFCKISNAIRGSNIQWRGRAFAASVPSDSSKSERRQKRVSKNERRAMVESFVDRYRASNAGKYPTTKAVQKEVGGGYYVIKRILEEVEFQSKISTTSRASHEPEAKEKTIVSSNVEKPVIEEAVISTTNDDDSNGPQKYTGIEKPVDSGMQTAKYEGSLDLDGLKDKVVQEAGQEPLESDKIAGIEKPVDSGIETAKSEGSLGLDGPKDKVVQEAGLDNLESDKIARDSLGEETKEDVVTKRSTLWGNLRSFADGVMKFWRSN